jgi:hypothetical protein
VPQLQSARRKYLEIGRLCLVNHLKASAEIGDATRGETAPGGGDEAGDVSQDTWVVVINVPILGER